MYQALYNKKNDKERRRKRAEEEMLTKEMADCTFQPNVNKTSRYVPEKLRGHSVPVDTAPIYMRSESWSKRKQATHHYPPLSTHHSCPPLATNHYPPIPNTRAYHSYPPLPTTRAHHYPTLVPTTRANHYRPTTTHHATAVATNHSTNHCRPPTRAVQTDSDWLSTAGGARE